MMFIFLSPGVRDSYGTEFVFLVPEHGRDSSDVENVQLVVSKRTLSHTVTVDITTPLLGLLCKI